MSSACTTAPATTRAIRLLLLGDSTVGKTSLILRWTENLFIADTNSLEVFEYKVRQVEVNRQDRRIAVFDTGGQERFRKLTSAVYKETDAIGFTYSSGDSESFKNLEGWLMEVKIKRDISRLPCVVIANKSDLSPASRAIKTEQGQSFASRNNMLFFETSARDNSNVDETMMALVRLVITREALESSGHQGDGSSSSGVSKSLSFTSSGGSDRPGGSRCCCSLS